MPSTIHVSAEAVRARFDYFPDGTLRWKLIQGDRSHQKLAGKKAGSISKHNGHYVVKMDGVLFMMHRIIFLYHHGYLPEQVDHIDGDSTNNKIENLRAANNSLNMFNKRVSSKSGTGVKNVGLQHGKFLIRIGANGKRRSFGAYDTLEEAAIQARKYRALMHGEFAAPPERAERVTIA